MNRIVTRSTTADKVRLGDVIVTENARGTQYRHPVTKVGPCLTDNHNRHISAPNGTTMCYSVLPEIQVAV